MKQGSVECTPMYTPLCCQLGIFSGRSGKRVRRVFCFGLKRYHWTSEETICVVELSLLKVCRRRFIVEVSEEEKYIF